MKCKECERVLIDKLWLTKNGCKWCDLSYYRSEKEEKRISAIIKILQDEL